MSPLVARFCVAADIVEKAAIHPFFFGLFNLGIVFGLVFGKENSTNIVISIVTADLMLLLLTREYRDNRVDKAEKAELLHATPGAREADEIEKEIDNDSLP